MLSINNLLVLVGFMAHQHDIIVSYIAKDTFESINYM